LSLTDNFAKLLDWIGRLRRGSFHEMLIVSLPPKAQPLQKKRHPQPKARRSCQYATIPANINGLTLKLDRRGRARS
jgi:hypothetical protein